MDEILPEEVAVPRPSHWIEKKGIRELGLVGGVLLIYYLIRGFVADQPSEARSHALAIVHLEQSLRFFWEPQLQRVLSHGLPQIQFWNGVYFWAHAPVIALVGCWLYLNHRRHYSFLRNAFLASAVLGLVIYWTYPVAPPRLLAGFGFVDTMQRYSELSYQAQSLEPFVNPYAAVPSLHFGWSLLIGVGLILSLRHPLGWSLGILLPLLMFFAILATANHFVFDALAGLAVCSVSLVAAFAVQRWQMARRRVTQPARRQVREPARV
jgi:hypothetical protein